ncbi:MAG: hypothetical protein ACLRJC_14610 [Emergencia timonensis]|uniref:hypothetical protein n=1 Tax=Emergencia timonensis TaxID=1776384 RepID=UPI00082E1E63|nr:hypothetical protein [Emergencia timonensis]WNX88022.1 hypothetical protein RVY71_17710 [Emergencia timonensis]
MESRIFIVGYCECPRFIVKSDGSTSGQTHEKPRAFIFILLIFSCTFFDYCKPMCLHFYISALYLRTDEKSVCFSNHLPFYLTCSARFIPYNELYGSICKEKSSICKGRCASKYEKNKNEGGNEGVGSVLCHHALLF